MSATNQPSDDDRAAVNAVADVQGREPGRPRARTADESVEDAVTRSLDDLEVERRSRHSVPPDAPSGGVPGPRGVAADER